MRPFRFLAGATEIVDGRTLAERARRAESLGYDALVIPDHLLEQPAPIPVMATIAAATERLRVGAFVFNNDLRHPAVLAQDLATIDVLSGGRLIVGVGAGWNRPEYEAIGLGFDPVGTRVGRLTESVAVLKGLFGDGAFSHHGSHYSIAQMDGQPKPVTRPPPPFLIGGGGRRLLALAGREADIVSLAPRIDPGTGRSDPWSITLTATQEKIGWVRDAAGTRFADLELNVYPSISPIVVTDDARREGMALADRIRSRTGHEVPVDDLLESPHVFIGSIAGLTEKLIGLRERLGISNVMLGELGALDPVVERLAGT